MSPKNGKPLLDYYVKKYEEAEGTRPVMNRTKKVWGFSDMYEDLGQDAPYMHLGLGLRTCRRIPKPS